MRRYHWRLGVITLVTLIGWPCASLAQSTAGADAAIAELRQLLADQRAALDRQARLIEEQGQALAALKQQIDGATRSAAETAPPSPAIGDGRGRRGRSAAIAIGAAGEPSGGRSRRRTCPRWR